MQDNVELVIENKGMLKKKPHRNYQKIALNKMLTKNYFTREDTIFFKILDSTAIQLTNEKKKKRKLKMCLF